MRGSRLLIKEAVATNNQTRLCVYKDLDGRSPKKCFVVRDEASYFYEAPGFSLPSLLVNPTLIGGLRYV